ncbi:hypothetical protein [Hyphococcus sp.]|uniref:hypothetical protein n=1 Tax=Hyphococcus sp. TaxID=2038636 RepID=UPI0035C6A2F2
MIDDEELQPLPVKDATALAVTAYGDGYTRQERMKFLVYHRERRNSWRKTYNYVKDGISEGEMIGDGFNFLGSILEYAGASGASLLGTIFKKTPPMRRMRKLSATCAHMVEIHDSIIDALIGIEE